MRCACAVPRDETLLRCRAMSGLVILVPVALGLGLVGLAAFFWSLRHKQFDDMDGAALRILIDEDTPLERRDDA
jgi:cbb3-type cytochrome oxidase maturation protein